MTTKSNVVAAVVGLVACLAILYSHDGPLVDLALIAAVAFGVGSNVGFCISQPLVNAQRQLLNDYMRRCGHDEWIEEE